MAPKHPVTVDFRKIFFLAEINKFCGQAARRKQHFTGRKKGLMSTQLLVVDSTLNFDEGEQNVSQENEVVDSSLNVDSTPSPPRKNYTGTRNQQCLNSIDAAVNAHLDQIKRRPADRGVKRCDKYLRDNTRKAVLFVKEARSCWMSDEGYLGNIESLTALPQLETFHHAGTDFLVKAETAFN